MLVVLRPEVVERKRAAVGALQQRHQCPLIGKWHIHRLREDDAQQVQRRNGRQCEWRRLPQPPEPADDRGRVGWIALDHEGRLRRYVLWCVLRVTERTQYMTHNTAAMSVAR